VTLIIQCHNPEDFNLKHHCHESLKILSYICITTELMSLSKFFVVKYCGIYEVFVTLKVMIHYEFVTMFHSLHCSMLNTVYCLELFSMCDIWGASPNANFK